MASDPRELYDATAQRWARQKPTSLSDFTGRPAVFEMVGNVRGKAVLDAGCGEGYCSRVLAERGADVLGVDISPQMIELANEQTPGGIRYTVGDVRRLPASDGEFHLAIAVFVFNYLSLADTAQALGELRRVLKPDGVLVFAVPHPAFPLLRANTPPFWFDLGGRGYFSARGERHAGKIWRIDGTALDVQVVHKTFEDYFTALRQAGFTRMPDLRELHVTAEHVAMDPAFFGPIQDVPLHVVLRV
jgi:ubiquinone/menaquinone biosynthesis C-methylase UbiE